MLAFFLFYIMASRMNTIASAIDEREGHADHEFLDEQVRNACCGHLKAFLLVHKNSFLNRVSNIPSQEILFH
jgi:hypothetical protein